MQQRKPTRKWWGAYHGLYGDPSNAPLGQGKHPKAQRSQLDLPLTEGKVSKPVTAKIKPAAETKEQIIAAIWLDKENIPYYHVPNGGRRDAREGAKFKRMGVKAGVPDICIPIARKGYHGLYIELKRTQGGSLSESQRNWRDILIREGYAWYEAKGADHLKQIVKDYLAC